VLTPIVYLLMSELVLLSLPCNREKVDQRLELVATEMPKLPPMLGGNGVVQSVDQRASLFGELRVDETTIFLAANATDQSGVFHAVEQPGDVGHSRDEALADLVSAETVGPGAAKHSQHIVLRCGQIVRRQDPIQGIAEEGVGARDVEERLLVDASKRLLLLQLGTEVCGHGRTMCVITPIVKTHKTCTFVYNDPK
jgi:hypothetical protein